MEKCRQSEKQQLHFTGKMAKVIYENLFFPMKRSFFFSDTSKIIQDFFWGGLKALQRSFKIFCGNTPSDILQANPLQSALKANRRSGK